MFVGNNLDCVAKFRERQESGNAHGDEPKVMPTWQRLYRLLDRAGLDYRRCFFTNAYVGLAVTESNEGDPKVPPGTPFDLWCARFLTAQIEEMQPKAIVTLGGVARRALGRWLNVPSWARTKAPPLGSVPVAAAVGAALVHPSGQTRNYHRATYEGLVGLEAEARLLCEVTTR